MLYLDDTLSEKNAPFHDITMHNSKVGEFRETCLLGYVEHSYHPETLSDATTTENCNIVSVSKYTAKHSIGSQRLMLAYLSQSGSALRLSLKSDIRFYISPFISYISTSPIITCTSDSRIWRM